MAVTGSMVREHELTEILNTPPQDLGPGEFQVLSMGALEEFLYYLPFAFQYLRDNRNDETDLSFSVLSFLHRSEPELHDLGLHPLIVSELTEIFFNRISVYTGNEIRKANGEIWVAATISGHQARDGFLSQLVEFPVHSGELPLVEVLLKSWAEVTTDICHSAHLLDLFYHIRVGTEFIRDIYSYPLACSLANNNQIRDQHWNIATALIESECPTEYYRAVKEM